MTKTCWQCGAEQLSDLELDKRAAKWRCRIRLYLGDSSEPQADSDPDLEADAPGTVICAGLRGVADTVIQMAAAFHDAPTLAGLEPATLDAKIRGLRPTLSRRGGNAVWRLPYTVGDNPWLARVDLERVAEPGADYQEPAKPTFRRTT